jgi:hypothetical protein
MPGSVTISGTRATSHHPDNWFTALFARYVEPFIGSNAHVYVGGAPGIDTLALRWLTVRACAQITVVVPARLADQPREARDAVASALRDERVTNLVELRHPRFPAVEAYHARNRWMVDRSELLIAFPLADSGASGTGQTIEYAASKRLPRLVVPV